MQSLKAFFFTFLFQTNIMSYGLLTNISRKVIRTLSGSHPVGKCIEPAHNSNLPDTGITAVHSYNPVAQSDILEYLQ
jgi:hypothetical protein